MKPRTLPGLVFGIALGCSLAMVASSRAHHTATHTPDILQNVQITQRLHEAIPLDVWFTDETGARVRLGDYFTTSPVLLTFAYFGCENLCPMVLNGLVTSLRTLSFTAGNEFTILTVSMDPRETPIQAAAAKVQYMQRYGRAQAESGWHFLTGEAEAIQRLTQAAGFQYAYDAKHNQYAHASGLMLLTPQGVLSRYFFGIEYPPRDLRLGLVEAAARRIGSPLDRLLLFCYHYDPATGAYSLLIMNVLRLTGVATVLTVGLCVGLMVYRERSKGKAHVV